MSTESEPWTWNSLLEYLRQRPPDSVAQISTSALPEPTSVGFQVLPVGADGYPVFGGAIDAEVGVVIRVIGEIYEVNLCGMPQPQQTPASPVVTAPAVRPAVSPALAQPTALAPQRATSQSLAAVPVRVESRAELVLQTRREQGIANFIADRPGETMIAVTSAGAAVGLLCGGARGALIGALVGAGVALASVTVSTAATSPVTAQLSATMFLALVANALGGRSQGPVLRLPPMGRPLLPPHQDDDEPPHPPRKPRKR